jgi:hypothetical protein
MENPPAGLEMALDDIISAQRRGGGGGRGGGGRGGGGGRSGGARHDGGGRGGRGRRNDDDGGLGGGGPVRRRPSVLDRLGPPLGGGGGGGHAGGAHGGGGRGGGGGGRGRQTRTGAPVGDTNEGYKRVRCTFRWSLLNTRMRRVVCASTLNERMCRRVRAARDACEAGGRQRVAALLRHRRRHGARPALALCAPVCALRSVF